MQWDEPNAGPTNPQIQIEYGDPKLVTMLIKKTTWTHREIQFLLASSNQNLPIVHGLRQPLQTKAYGNPYKILRN